jgi:riboflavin kinase/FMN adenylyltransferase
MLIHRDPKATLPISKAVVTIGTFDGVHLGHQKIIERLVKEARKIGAESVVVTFWPHPRLILQPNDNSLKLLNTFDEKAELLTNLGVNHLVTFTFDKEFSELTKDQFVRDILLKKLNTVKIIIGYDHRFGKNREGDFAYLKELGMNLGFETEEISKREIDEIAVSSTKIRKALLEGDVRQAQDFLGRPYRIGGRVISGNRLGRTIGFPTANIQLDDFYKLVPTDGVYGVEIRIKGRIYQGMLNIGSRPTIGDQKHSIECHIFNFSDEIYGEEIKIDFRFSIRKQIKFESMNQLKNQLQQDSELVRSLFST